jgi:hypothetical protein
MGATIATALEVEQPELALDDLPERFRGELLRPGDPGYDEAPRVWNAAIDRYPALIANWGPFRAYGRDSLPRTALGEPATPAHRAGL